MNDSSAGSESTRGVPDDAAEAKRRTRAGFNAAADFYDSPPLSYWNDVARGTIDNIGVVAGERVLDVCCGSGASALEAADRGATVIGIDIAENLLALGEAKARERGLTNVEFIAADMEAIDLPPESFDAVVCVFGIFFAADMERQLGELWRFVAPGGRLAITSWGERCLEPGQSAIFAAMRELRPDLVPTGAPWDRIATPATLAELFTAAELPEPDVVPEGLMTDLDDPDGVWKIALGSGYRGAIDQLSDEQRERMRDDLCAGGFTTLTSDILYASVAKPGGAA